ncbi:DNA ligase-like domain-containing protein [Streptomyces coeruleorubidus]|uniref:hypothetical protein n=1 Tax=Streptomyces coeruleorubidus TaxID=116188 RepID=UPI0036AADF62
MPVDDRPGPARKWLEWTAAGVEGLCFERLEESYRGGVRSWRKYKVKRISAELAARHGCRLTRFPRGRSYVRRAMKKLAELLSGDLLQCAVPAWGAGGRQADYLAHPPDDGGAVYPVAAGQIAGPLVTAQHCQHDAGDPRVTAVRDEQDRPPGHLCRYRSGSLGLGLFSLLGQAVQHPLRDRQLSRSS